MSETFARGLQHIDALLWRVPGEIWWTGVAILVIGASVCVVIDYLGARQDERELAASERAGPIEIPEPRDPVDERDRARKWSSLMDGGYDPTTGGCVCPRWDAVKRQCCLHEAAQSEARQE